ncbi:hypothetical protein W97_04447 [Coniosporium apollinis CBS 100218]|uniref:Uncharacterized protein n=1 Tax=Coniosporium apollinis (strain CBS 100218) TaxID=1168221 RepID=R7YTJ4_CONA1|nr:uncharacterized protein W97_04447 [Coniosporium apollinis CBS 100218]EON65210.1 hypothetical protein W97_04447 [Coniosporium apollinis CBS 100218]
MIREVAQGVIRGETSEAQKERVAGLQKADNANRLRMKKTHSVKKTARKGGSRSDY